MQPADRLLPRPARLVRGDGRLPIDSPIDARVPRELPELERRALLAAVERLGWSRPGGESDGEAETVRLDLTIDPGQPAQGYHLIAGTERVEIRGGDAAGLFYGIATLRQWLAAHRADAAAARVPTVEVEDAPAFPVRGVMLDVSRNRVPQLDSLERLVARLAALKINQLQLYTEHTFAYQGHEVVWQGWSPLTPADVRRLDEVCRRNFVELVPNQNSFGHLHRWLVHPPYRPLAECPEGIEHPFSEEKEPFSLCPTDPRSLELLADLYDQLLPNFSSRDFNVGLDETLDLGRGRSREECERRGRTTVYLDFLRRVHRLVRERGFRMLFWADILLEEPERTVELPADVVALDWGYEADHPFERETRALAEAGREFWVCPGTSSWNSLLGRTGNALANLESAARWGSAHGAGGLLVTDWGDFGHLQPRAVSYPGLVAAAARGWSPDHPTDALAEPLALWMYAAESPSLESARELATAVLELGDVYRLPGTPSRNGSVLFYLLLFSDQDLRHGRYAGLDRRGLERVREHLADADRLERHGLCGRELAWAARLADVGAQLGVERLALGVDRPVSQLAPTVRRALRDALERAIDELPTLWLERDREGGLGHSVARLRRWAARFA